jgi:hypothetical protein
MDDYPSSTSNRTEIIHLNIRIRSINNWQFERAPVYQQMNKFRRKQERSSLAHLETNKSSSRPTSPGASGCPGITNVHNNNIPIAGFFLNIFSILSRWKRPP